MATVRYKGKKWTSIEFKARVASNQEEKGITSKVILGADEDLISKKPVVKVHANIMEVNAKKKSTVGLLCV